jgi:hypothetical protein
MHKISILWKKALPFLAAAAVLGAVGTAAVRRYVGNDSCCTPGASCCYPGSPCCKGHNKQPLAER